jgi:hypothetical protein
MRRREGDEEEEEEGLAASRGRGRGRERERERKGWKGAASVTAMPERSRETGFSFFFYGNTKLRDGTRGLRGRWD